MQVDLYNGRKTVVVVVVVVLLHGWIFLSAKVLKKYSEHSQFNHSSKSPSDFPHELPRKRNILPFCRLSDARIWAYLFWREKQKFHNILHTRKSYDIMLGLLPCLSSQMQNKGAIAFSHKSAGCTCCCQLMGQTDGQTDMRPLHIPCYAININKPRHNEDLGRRLQLFQWNKICENLRWLSPK